MTEKQLVERATNQKCGYIHYVETLGENDVVRRALKMFISQAPSKAWWYKEANMPSAAKDIEEDVKRAENLLKKLKHL